MDTQTFLSLRERAANGCLEWTGYTVPKGYGWLSFRGRSLGAHRVAWLLAHGPIPEGLFVCHTCDNRRCVDTEHLFLGTAKDNQRDMAAKGRGTTKVLCTRGHDLSDNPILDAKGQRHCRKCHRMRVVQSDRRHREQRNASRRAWRQRRRAAGMAASS